MKLTLLAAITMLSLTGGAHAESCSDLRAAMDYTGMQIRADAQVVGEFGDRLKLAGEMNDMGQIQLYAAYSKQALYTAIARAQHGVDLIDRMKAKGGCFEFSSTLNNARKKGVNTIAAYKRALRSVNAIPAY